jgi:hypothetical protein
MLSYPLGFLGKTNKSKLLMGDSDDVPSPPYEKIGTLA